MVRVLTYVGTKYHQETTHDTPAKHVVDGFRQEDSHWAGQLGNGSIRICVADGHGSLHVKQGKYAGGREMADACCRVCEMHARTPVADLFPLCQSATKLIEFNADDIWHEDGSLSIRPMNSKRHRVTSHGTTLSILELAPPGNRSTFAHVGDSTGLLVRDDGTFSRLGEPHTVRHATEVLRMRQKGATIHKDYFEFKLRGSTQRCMLSRAIGHFGPTPISQTPDVIFFNTRQSDRIVVATDGLWDHITTAAAADIVLNSHTEDEAADRLMKVVRESSKPHDNTTIVVHFITNTADTQVRLREHSCCTIM